MTCLPLCFPEFGVTHPHPQAFYCRFSCSLPLELHYEAFHIPLQMQSERKRRWVGKEGVSLKFRYHMVYGHFNLFLYLMLCVNEICTWSFRWKITLDIFFQFFTRSTKSLYFKEPEEMRVIQKQRMEMSARRNEIHTTEGSRRTNSLHLK